MITGLLLAMTLPPTLSLELAVIGSVVGIGLGKAVFGGLGYNIFNPAMVGRARRILAEHAVEPKPDEVLKEIDQILRS